MITLSPAAAREIHDAIERSDADDLRLRVAARITETGDVEFGMGFDEQRDDDVVFEDKGVPMLVGKPSRELLTGTLLDYIEVEPGRFGFVFSPLEDEAPAPKSGGCGSGGCSKCGGA